MFVFAILILINFIIKINMAMRQTLIKKFFKPKDYKDSSSDYSSDQESNYLPSKTKAMYDKPMSWTRVKSIEQAVS